MKISFDKFDPHYWPVSLAQGVQVFLNGKPTMWPIAADEERGEVEFADMDAKGQPARDEDGRLVRVKRFGRVDIKMPADTRAHIAAALARPPLFTPGDRVCSVHQGTRRFGVVQWRCSGRCDDDGSFTYAVLFEIGGPPGQPVEFCETHLGRGAIQ